MTRKVDIHNFVHIHRVLWWRLAKTIYERRSIAIETNRKKEAEEEVECFFYTSKQHCWHFSHVQTSENHNHHKSVDIAQNSNIMSMLIFDSSYCKIYTEISDYLV